MRFACLQRSQKFLGPSACLGSFWTAQFPSASRANLDIFQKYTLYNNVNVSVNVCLAMPCNLLTTTLSFRLQLSCDYEQD